VGWVAGEIGLRYLVQSRTIEWWFHQEDIREGAGLEGNPQHDPVYLTNDMAIRMLPWALEQAGLSFPGRSIRVDLEGVGGGTWHWGLEPRTTPPADKKPDAFISGRGTAFVSSERRLVCTLVAWWDEGDTEPWFLLTDLAPEGCDAAWYGLRGWCEQGFKCFKRGGWPWQYTQMTAPDRAARLWLAVAVATLWMMSVGSALEVGPPPEGMDVPDLRPLLGAIVATPRHPRRLRLLRLGWLWCLVCQITTGGLPLPQRFIPEPWPAIPIGVQIVTFHQNTLAYNEL
jgi:hypothetical protein